MHRITRRPLSEVHREVTTEQMEQDITELEIMAMGQEQEITDHDIAILELKQKISE